MDRSYKKTPLNKTNSDPSKTPNASQGKEIAGVPKPREKSEQTDFTNSSESRAQIFNDTSRKNSPVLSTESGFMSSANRFNDFAQAGGGPGNSDSNISKESSDKATAGSYLRPAAGVISNVVERGPNETNTQPTHISLEIREALQNGIAPRMLSNARQKLQNSLDTTKSSNLTDTLKQKQNREYETHKDLVQYSIAAPDRADYEAPWSQGALVMVAAALTFGAARSAAMLGAKPLTDAIMKDGPEKDSATIIASWGLGAIGGGVGSLTNTAVALPVMQRLLKYQLEEVPVEVILPEKVRALMKTNDINEGKNRDSVADLLKYINKTRDDAKNLGSLPVVAAGIAGFVAGTAGRVATLNLAPQNGNLQEYGMPLALGIGGSGVGGLASGLALGVAKGRAKVKVPTLNDDGNALSGNNIDVNLFYAREIKPSELQENSKKAVAATPKTSMEVGRSLVNRTALVGNATKLGAGVLWVGAAVIRNAKTEALAKVLRIIVPIIAIATVIKRYFSDLVLIGKYDNENNKIAKAKVDNASVGTTVHPPPETTINPSPETTDHPLRTAKEGGVNRRRAQVAEPRETNQLI
jgi:hypothetical protein